MASNVEINITAKDNASGKLRQLSSAFQSLTGFSMSSAAAIGLMSKAMYEAIQFTKSSVTETVKYAAQVRDLSRLTGMAAEETSRMIQVTDDLDLSYEQLSTSLKAAVRQGIDPSIESIAALSDEYLALEPGLERSKFLMDNFGRAGADMAKVMEQGGDALLGMSADMEESMIMTDENVRAAREYEIALDGAKDAIDAVKYRLGNQLLPVLTDTLNKIEEHSQAVDNETNSLITLKNNITPATNSIIDMADANEQLAQAAQDAGYYIKDGALWMLDASSGVRTLIDANYILTQSYIESYNAINDYNTDMRTVVEITGLAYTSNEDYIASLAGLPPAMETVGASIEVVNASFRELTDEMIYNAAAAGLDADSALELARGMGLLNEDTYATLSQLQQLRAEYDTNADGAITAAEGAHQYSQEVLRIKAGLTALDGTTATISIIEDYRSGYIGATRRGFGYANGADFTVPSGYPNDTFGPMFAQSGEHVSITPAGGQPEQGGNTIIFNYSPTVSLADEYEAQTKLMPFIQAALRGNQ